MNEIYKLNLINLYNKVLIHFLIYHLLQSSKAVVSRPSSRSTKQFTVPSLFQEQVPRITLPSSLRW